MAPEDDKIATKLSERLCKVQQVHKKVEMSEEEIDYVLDKVKVLFLERPMLLEIKAPVKVLGDIHGQFHDLLQVFDQIDFPSKNNQMLFLGDYVDRGKWGLETVMLLFSFKIQYPDHIHLLRGNHESKSVSRVYGFYEECKDRYSAKVWKRFMEVFDCLPVACVISKAILCMHGGLSPHIKTMDDIKKLPRPSDIPPGGLMADLLWADPDKALKNGWAQNPRGVSFIFAADIVHAFIKKHDLDLIIRAHQVVFHGYELFAEGRLITLFTAPNFCGQFLNKGGIATIDKQLKLSLTFIEAQKGKKKAAVGTSTTREASKSPAAIPPKEGPNSIMQPTTREDPNEETTINATTARTADNKPKKRSKRDTTPIATQNAPEVDPKTCTNRDNPKPKEKKSEKSAHPPKKASNTKSSYY